MSPLSVLSRSVKDVRVLVTGAGSGMGAATARLFADEGARVMVVDRRADAAQAVAAEIASVRGPDCVRWAAADVSLAGDRQRCVEALVEEWGGVDVLVNNAGISRVSSVDTDDTTFDENWETTLAVNLTAQAHLIRSCRPWLERAPSGGRVVNIASTEALMATGGLAAYTASKHGVIGLTRSFAVELGRRNVTVNAVCPGPIETAMTAGIPEPAKEKYARRRVPVGRYGTAEEVAHMVLNLCLPASTYVNGAVIVVDGGMSAQH